MSNIQQHDAEIHKNRDSWLNKPVLQKVYRCFHETIAKALPDACGHIVELGSGVPDITEVIPGCIRTDIFPNPWIDQVENAYALSFADASVSALVLFDVFHHLRYPGTALEEFQRVLVPGGRVIILDPCISLLGHIVYGILHHEPLGMECRIEWRAPAGWSPADSDYYAAQGNAHRIFLGKEIDVDKDGWTILGIHRLAAISYVLSGGYSKPQMYPDCAFPLLQGVDRLCDRLPGIFATRLLVVLEKTAV